MIIMTMKIRLKIEIIAIVCFYTAKPWSPCTEADITHGLIKVKRLNE